MPKSLFSLLSFVAGLLGCGQLYAHPVPESPQWLTYAGGDGPRRLDGVAGAPSPGAASNLYRDSSNNILSSVPTAIGGYTVQALYGGNSNYASSSSPVLNFSIVPSANLTTVLKVDDGSAQRSRGTDDAGTGERKGCHGLARVGSEIPLRCPLRLGQQRRH